MVEFAMSKPTRLTLREAVASQLRTAILDGQITPGTHLGEVELSVNLDVSRATLREAMRQLQQEGLLTQDGRGRVSVRKVSAAEVHDIFEVRLGLEAIAVGRLCAMRDRDSAVAVLRGKLERLRAPLSIREDMDADLDFHGTLCELAGNQILYSAWSSIGGVIRITMMAAGPDSARQNASFDRHRPIVDFIEAGDSGGARQYLRHHMDTAAQLLLERMG